MILKVMTGILLSLHISWAQTSSGWLPFGGRNSASDGRAAHVDDITVLLENVREATDAVEPTLDLFSDLWNAAFLSSFSSHKILPAAMLEKVPSSIRNVILYKPPIGVTMLFVLFDLLVSRNKKVAASFLMSSTDSSETISTLKRKKKYMGRSLHLDADDRKLLMGLGGVEAVRTELCAAALIDYIDEPGLCSETCIGDNITSSKLNPKTLLSDYSNISYFASAARDALMIKTMPRSSNEYYVERTLEPLAKLQYLFEIGGPLSFRHSRQSDNFLPDLLWMSTKLAEVRSLDALLRILRERLLTSAVRLSKKKRYRQWRLEWYENAFGRFWKLWFRQMIRGKTIEDDRRNLQLTTAALRRETERLGQVQTVLLERPVELRETCLLIASSFTSDELESGCIENSDSRTKKKYCAGDILPNGAKEALQSTHLVRNGDLKGREVGETTDLRDWTAAAMDWTARARLLISDLVTETMRDVFQPEDFFTKNRKTTIGYDLEVLDKWSTYSKCDREGWSTTLMLCSNLSKPRLMREKKYIPTANHLKSILNNHDIFGAIPSLAAILGAVCVHNAVKPIFSDIVITSRLFANTLWGILEFRFWNPLKVIVLDLLNQSPRLLDSFALEEEEKSLDNMLRDMGLGDGTQVTRAKALVEAANIYEKELAGGAVKNIFRGDMVRLLLIQVQQMKTGMLQAMGSIDDLMDSNRLNVQLLAVVPAILIVTLGTRLFLSAMYSLRSRNLVGISNAKTELGDLLMKMERDLLLAGHEHDSFASDGYGDYFNYSHTMKLKSDDLGKVRGISYYLQFITLFLTLQTLFLRIVRASYAHLLDDS